MRRLTFLLIRSVGVAAAVAAIACGGSKSPAAPSGATPAQLTAAPSGASTSGATISGTVVGGVLGTTRLHAQSGGSSVRVTGTSVSSPIDASGAFVLHGVPAGTVHLQFSINGTNTTLEVDDVAEHQEIHVTVVLAAGSAEVDNDERETPDNQVEIEGRITAISGNTLHVADKDVTVPSGARIVHGGTALTLADLHVGDRIHVHGTKNGASIVATSIEDQTSNPVAPVPPPGDDHDNDGGNDGGEHNDQAELNGTISAKTGSCPTLTFTIASTKVSTNASTEFKDVACSSLSNGDSAEVKGTRQTNGSVLASSVEKKK
jgi:hypothetical protein